MMAAVVPIRKQTGMPWKPVLTCFVSNQFKFKTHPPCAVGTIANGYTLWPQPLAHHTILRTIPIGRHYNSQTPASPRYRSRFFPLW